MDRPNVLNSSEPVTLRPVSPASPLELEQARIEARQRKGKVLVVGGWIFALVGVVLYCVATFATAPDADLAAVVLKGVVPGARAALVIVAGGVVFWITGSVMHTGAAIDAAELDARTQRQQPRT